MNSIPLISNVPGVNFSMNRGNASPEIQMRQEINTSLVALKKEAGTLEGLINEASQILDEVNNRIATLENDTVKKSDIVDVVQSGNMNPVTSNAVAGAIGALDASSVGGTGKYISAISETDGKINATATDLGNMVPVNSVTSGNMHSVTSNAVNVRCAAIGEWFTLIQRTSVPSTATNKTLAYDRKISNYVLILFTIGNSSSNTRETMLIPASQLTENATVYGFCYVGGILKEVDIQVISDTVIKVNGDDVLNFGMYGIMKR